MIDESSFVEKKCVWGNHFYDPEVFAQFLRVAFLEIFQLRIGKGARRKIVGSYRIKWRLLSKTAAENIISSKKLLAKKNICGTRRPILG